jgi:hypothetical protein
MVASTKAHQWILVLRLEFNQREAKLFLIPMPECWPSLKPQSSEKVGEDAPPHRQPPPPKPPRLILFLSLEKGLGRRQTTPDLA